MIARNFKEGAAAICGNRATSSVLFVLKVQIMATPLCRRKFLRSATVLTSSLAFGARSWKRVYGANERLRVASIGTGGKGWSDLTATAASPHVQVVAICDIDESKEHLGRAAEQYPETVRYTNWKKLLDRQGDFDAVIVSTPESHACANFSAGMQLGKHVQCQKPLTHTCMKPDR